MKRPLPLLTAFLVALLGTAFANTLTPAGTAITNQASASYKDAANVDRTALSNTVTTNVTQVYSFSITPNSVADGAEFSSYARDVDAYPSDVMRLEYLVTNTGNGLDTINLSTALGAGNSFVGQNLHLEDATGNTITALALAQGAQATVFVVMTVPSSLKEGTALVNLVGVNTPPGDSGQSATTDDDNWSRVIAKNRADLSLALSLDNQTPKPSDTLSYTVSGQNIGARPAGNVTNVITVGTGAEAQNLRTCFKTLLSA